MAPSEKKFFVGAYHVSPKEPSVQQQEQQQQLQARPEQGKQAWHTGTSSDLSTRAAVLIDLDRPPAFFGTKSYEDDWFPDDDSGKRTYGPDVT